MARQTRIEQLGLEARVLELAGQGLASREIAARLAAENGVRLSHVAVAGYLRQVRAERREITQRVVEQRLQATLPRDLDILDEMIAQLRDWFRDGALGLQERLMVAAQLRHTLRVKLHYAGADTPRDRLDEMIERLLGESDDAA